MAEDGGSAGTSKRSKRRKKPKPLMGLPIDEKWLSELRNHLKSDGNPKTLSDEEKVETLCHFLIRNKIGMTMKMLDHTKSNQYIAGKSPMYFALTSQYCSLQLMHMMHITGYAADDVIDQERKLTAFHGAVCMNNTSIVQFFLKQPININVKDSLGCSPVYTATQEQNLEMIKLLVENGADINVKCDENLQTPLFYAIGVQHLEIVKLLLSLGADANLFCRHGRDSISPLHFAAVLCNLKIVQALLDSGANVNSKSPESKETPLHQAAGVNLKRPKDKIACACIVQLLIQSGSDTKAEDESELTPLHVAIRRSNYEIAKVLVCHDSSPLNHNLAFHELMKSNEKNLILECMKRGANLFLKDPDGRYPVTVFVTSMIYRFASDHRTMETEDIIDVVKTIWESGFPVELTVPKNVVWSKPSTPAFLTILRQLVISQTTLFQGVTSNNPNLVKQAIARGAVLAATSNKLEFPLHRVATKGNDKSLELFLLKHMKVNLLDKQGKTPLHYAAESGHLKCCLLLLEKGAIYNYKSLKCPFTPLELAEKKKHKDVVELLQKINHIFHLLLKKGKLAKLEPLNAVISCKNRKGNTLLESALLMDLTSIAERILKKKLKCEKTSEVFSTARGSLKAEAKPSPSTSFH